MFLALHRCCKMHRHHKPANKAMTAAVSCKIYLHQQTHKWSCHVLWTTMLAEHKHTEKHLNAKRGVLSTSEHTNHSKPSSSSLGTARAACRIQSPTALSKGLELSDAPAPAPVLATHCTAQQHILKGSFKGGSEPMEVKTVATLTELATGKHHAMLVVLLNPEQLNVCLLPASYMCYAVRGNNHPIFRVTCHAVTYVPPCTVHICHSETVH